MAARRLRRRWWYVHRGAAVKKPIRTELESEHRHRHHWPVFGPRNVIVREHIPQGDLRIVDLAIRLGPVRQPIAGWVLIGIFARGVALLRTIGRHPHVIRRKTRPPHYQSVRLDEGRTIFAWN